jgi:hypothetical protein
LRKFALLHHFGRWTPPVSPVFQAMVTSQCPKATPGPWPGRRYTFSCQSACGSVKHRRWVFKPQKRVEIPKPWVEVSPIRDGMTCSELFVARRHVWKDWNSFALQGKSRSCCGGAVGR